MPSKRTQEALKSLNSFVPFAIEDQSSLEATIEDYFISSGPSERESYASDSDEDDFNGKYFTNSYMCDTLSNINTF